MKFTILRLCAFPRLIFYCSCTPPEQTTTIVEDFQRNLLKRVSDLIEVDWNDNNREAIFQKGGLGLPDLIENSHLLFDDASSRFNNNNYSRVNLSLGNFSSRLVHSSDRLTANSDLDKHLKKNVRADWLFTNQRGTKESPLNNVEFNLCLAMRCHALPRQYSFQTEDSEGRKINNRFKCEVFSCQKTITTDAEYIDHIFTCKAGATHVSYTDRHDRLKFAISAVASCTPSNLPTSVLN